MVCKRCNNIISDNSSKCPHCGYRVMPPAQAAQYNAYNNQVQYAQHAAQPAKKKDNSTTIVLIVAGALGGFFIIILLLVFLLSGSGGGSYNNNYNGNGYFQNNNITSEDVTLADNAETTTVQTTQNNNEYTTNAPVQQTTAPAVESFEMTEGEIITLYNQANNVCQGWLDHGWAAANIDFNDYITVGTMRYCRVITAEYMSIDEIRNACSKYFEPSFYEDTINSYYKMHNGNLYAIESIGTGGMEPYDSLGIEIVENTDNYCRFKIMCYNGNNIEYSYENSMKKVNGSWIFTSDFTSSYSLYFNDNINWIY